MDINKEAYQLVRGHIAQDLESAKKILVELEEKRRKSDITIFYTNFQLIKDIFGKNLIDERSYNCSDIRMGFIPSGFLEKTSKIEDLAFGKIMEFVPKEEGKEVKLVALVKNFNYQDYKGIFLINSSAEEVRKRGSKTFDEQYNKKLYRMEFQTIGEDPLFGIFSAWNNNDISQQGSLALWIHRNKVLTI